MGGFFYFSASDGQNGTTGRELWRTDGTAGGTTLVKDINPGAGDSSPDLLTVVGTNLFFVATDGVHGRELWKSDGTSAGTVMVVDLVPGGADAGITEIEPAGSGVFFSTNGAVFKSDGTAGGTVQLLGPKGSVFMNAVNVWTPSGTNLAFVDNNNTLWRTDGTTSGTFALETVTSGSVYSVLSLDPMVYYFTDSFGSSGETNFVLRHSINSAGSSQLVDQEIINDLNGYTAELFNSQVQNGNLYYQIDWTFDDGIDPIQSGINCYSVNNSSSLVGLPLDGENFAGTIAGWVYFWSYSDKIYRTDGTSNNTTLVINLSGLTNINAMVQAGSKFFFTPPGVTDLTPSGSRLLPIPGIPFLLGSIGSNGLFTANDGVTGQEPWVSDGTTNGTHLLKDIASGVASPPPNQGVIAGTNLYFTLPRPGLGTQLWKSDGTTNGTALIRDFIQPAYGPSNLVAWNNLLFFSANDGTHGMELWRSDGTSNGTFMVKDCRVGLADSFPSQLTPASSLLFFVADDGAHGAELWESDGTSNGTFMAQDIVPGLAPGQIANMQAVGDTVYFIAASGSLGQELWFSTGQPGGTQFLADLNPGPASSNPFAFIGFNGKVYFLNTAGPYTGLWRTDGTPGGTVLVTNITVFGGSQLLATSNSLFMATGLALWQSDGTTGGTVLLTNTPISQLTLLGSTLYGSDINDVWSIAPTNGTATLAADFGTLNPPMSSPQQFTPFQGALLFTEAGPPFGREFWSIVPGQVATLAEDLNPGAADANIQFAFPLGNQVLYAAQPAGQPWQLRSLKLQNLLPPPKAPWGGVPWPVPGLIEAENFDVGGEGVSYHDLSIVNEGGQYRITEAVDIFTCDDTNGGFCVSGTQVNEWMDYTIQAPVDGTYEIDVRMTAPVVDTGFFHFELDGVPVVSGLAENNGAPGGWTTEQLTDVPIPAGVHNLRLVFDDASSAGEVGTYNSFNVLLTATNQPPIVSIVSPPSGTVFGPTRPIELIASVTDPTPGTNLHAEFFLDGQSIGVTSSPYALAWTPTFGPHVLRVTATDGFGASSTTRGQLFFVTNTILTKGAFWKVNGFGTNFGTSWRSTTYNDSSWPSAHSPFGFGYAGVTLLPSNFNNAPIVTYYFRQTVKTDLSGLNYLGITLRRDDGAVVYVNDHEIARPNMPGPPTNILFNTLAVTNVRNNLLTLTNPAVDALTVPLSDLSTSSNIFAVEVHQALTNRLDLYDFYFDLDLAGYTYNPGSALAITAAPGGPVVQWPDYLPDWLLEQSPDLLTWSTVTNLPGFTNGLAILPMPNQPQMFFRLRQGP